MILTLLIYVYQSLTLDFVIQDMRPERGITEPEYTHNTREI